MRGIEPKTAWDDVSTGAASSAGFVGRRNFRIAARTSLTQRAALALVAVAGWAASVAAKPVIAIGLDAYRQWARWPMQRIGVGAYMRSTYHRKGGNERADAAHYL